MCAVSFSVHLSLRASPGEALCSHHISDSTLPPATIGCNRITLPQARKLGGEGGRCSFATTREAKWPIVRLDHHR